LLGSGGRRRRFGLDEGFDGEVDFVDFAAVAEIQAEDLAGAKPDEFSLGQDGEKLFLDVGQRGDIGLVAGEEAFMEGFEFGGAEGADVMAELAVPIDENALGDLEVPGDAGEAVALGAEFEESVLTGPFSVTELLYTGAHLTQQLRTVVDLDIIVHQRVGVLRVLGRGEGNPATHLSLEVECHSITLEEVGLFVQAVAAQHEYGDRVGDACQHARELVAKLPIIRRGFVRRAELVGCEVLPTENEVHPGGELGAGAFARRNRLRVLGDICRAGGRMKGLYFGWNRVPTAKLVGLNHEEVRNPGVRLGCLLGKRQGKERQKLACHRLYIFLGTAQVATDLGRVHAKEDVERLGRVCVH
jgi:hypothetical protein